MDKSPSSECSPVDLPGGLWPQSMMLQQGDQLPPGARIVSVTELARLGVALGGDNNSVPTHRVSVLSTESLQRLLAGGQTQSVTKPSMVQNIVTPNTVVSSPQHHIRITLPQETQQDPSRSTVMNQLMPRVNTAQFSPQQGVREDKLEDGRTSSLHDRLVGVPTMGRVIHMSELNRMAIPEMRIVLQSDTKLDDLEGLDTSSITQTQTHSLPLGSYIGKHNVSVVDLQGKQSTPVVDIQEKQTSSIEDIQSMMLPLTTSQTSQIEPALIELVGQSLPHNLAPPLPPSVTQGGNLHRVADKTHPAVVTEEMLAEYRTAARYDAIWKCQGGRYKVHRLVLALASPLLRQVLSCQDHEGVRPVVCTPDISSITVKAILCLFYTGKVNVARDIMGEVNETLKMLLFRGEHVTVLPNQEIIKQEISPDYDIAAENFCEVAIAKSKKGGRVKQEQKQEDSDEDWNVDSAFDPEVQGEGESDDDWWEAENKRNYRKRKLSNVKSERWSDEDDEGKAYSGFKRGRKSLKTPDTHEMFRTRGSGKGERSFQLSLDLFEGKNVDFIYVCHACYSIFDTFKKLALHKDDAHPDNPEKYGPHHTQSVNQYNCPKCNQLIRVKHIVWFCKHLRYCRENNDIANALVGPEEEESDNEENGFIGSKRKCNKKTELVEGSPILMKDTDERLRITGEQKGKNVQTLSKMLVGRVVDYIWACKLCYSVHLSEAELESHKQTTHIESEKIGKYWSANTENYTCPFCEQAQNSRHLLWFIYHMRKCNMATVPFIKKEINEEEDTEDEEETEGDEHDPDQIVLRTFNIKSERSEWICESLLGKLVDRIYSCHVCYTVYESAEELRQHFTAAHGNISNRVRNGPYFRVDTLNFNCPVCHKDVCRKHSNSIFFIYHFRKCAGQAFQMLKNCQECGKEFSLYPNYKLHCDTHKALRSFMCHVCTKVFPSNARLNYHVQYVHSAYKPFQCTKCSKAYKRKAELLEHEEMSHSTHFNYSCDKCGKQFYGKKNLALHMKTHYSEEEKKHVCTICGYRFAKIKFLKNHMTTHSDIRQYACEICGARVKTRDTLKQHRKKLHNLLTPVPKNAEVEEHMREEEATQVMTEEQRRLEGVTTITGTAFVDPSGLDTRVINTL